MYPIRHVGIHSRYCLQINVSPLLQYRKHYLGDKEGRGVKRKFCPKSPLENGEHPTSIVPLMDGMDCIRYVVGSARWKGGSRAGNPPSVTGTTRCIRIWADPYMMSLELLESLVRILYGTHSTHNTSLTVLVHLPLC